MPKPSFGDLLRGLRLGFRYLDGVGFVRIADDGPFHVTIAQGAEQMSAGSECHRCWWEGPEMRAQLVEILKPFAGHGKVRLVLDEDGQVVEVR